MTFSSMESIEQNVVNKFTSAAERLVAEKGDVKTVASLLAMVIGQSTTSQTSLITQSPVRRIITTRLIIGAYL